MYNADGEIPSEMVEEKTEDELAEVLSAYRGNWFSCWRVGLSVLTLAAVVLILQSYVKEGEQLKQYLGFESMDDYSDEGMALVLEIVNLRKREKLSRRKSDPSNKAYFMDYVVTSFANGGEYQPMEEILAEAERVDPENSYYYYLAASIHTASSDGTACVKKVSPGLYGSSYKTDMGQVEEWEVLDREQYEMALNYIKEAGKRQGILDHTIGVRLEKLEKFRMMKEGKEMDWLGQNLAAYELVMEDHYSIRIVGMSRIFDTKFYELSKNGTAVEVSFWINEYKKLIDTLLDERGSIIDFMVAKALLKSPLANMREAAEQAGMDAEVEQITACIDQLNEDQVILGEQRKVYARDSEAFPKEAYSRDSYLMHYSGAPNLIHAVEKDKVVLPSMKEGRFGDHAFSGRLLTLLSFLGLVIVVIGMWIFFFAKRKQMRTLSMQSLSALTIMDGVLVVVGGVVLPVSLYLMVNEWMALTLSVREWSVLTMASALVVIQFSGMLVTVLTLSMALLHWRLSVRLPGIISRVRILRWVLPVLSFSAMILVGLTDTKGETLPWNIAGAFISLAILGWVVMAGVSAFRKKDELSRIAMCRGMLSVYACLLVVFAGLYHYYHAQEKHWVSESEEITFKPEYLGVMTIEYRTAQQMRKEMKERLELIR